MIVSSTYTLSGLEADGRRWCREVHTDHLGVEHIVRYLAAVGADYAAILADRATRVWADLVGHEIEAALKVDASPTLQYATKTDFVPVYRQAYQESEREECAQLATWILHRITDGWVTDTQVRNAFGLTAGEWTTLKSKMQTLADHYAAVLAARGE